MSRRSTMIIGLIAFAFGVAWVLWPTDEARIKRLFREGASAIQQKKTEDVMKKVAYHYSDDHGMSYLFLREGMTKLFPRFEKISVEYEIKEIRVEGEKAVAEVGVRVLVTSGTDTGYIVGDAGKARPMKFHLEKERATWLVARTEGMKAAILGQ